MFKPCFDTISLATPCFFLDNPLRDVLLVDLPPSHKSWRTLGLRQNTLTWNLGKYCPVRPRYCLDLRRQLRKWQVAPRASSRSSCRGWEGTRISDWFYSPESRDRQLQVTSARTVPLFDMRSTIFTTTRDVAMAENVESSLESVATRLLTHISTSTRDSSAFRKMSAQSQCCRGRSC